MVTAKKKTMAKGMKEYKLNSKLQEEIMVQAQLGAGNRSKSWMIVIITLVALIVLGLFLLLGRELFAGKAVSFSLEKDFLASAEVGFNGGDERAVYYSYAALTDASRPGLENEIRLATVSFKVVAPAVSTQKIYKDRKSD